MAVQEGVHPLDQEHSTALKASHYSCSTLKDRRHASVQRNAIEATCSIERTPNNKSGSDGRCKELQTLWDGCFSNGSSAKMHWFAMYLQPTRKLFLSIESDDIHTYTCINFITRQRNDEWSA